MPRNKLQAALKNNGGAIANVTPRYEKLTDEQMRLAAFEARDNQEGAITDKMANSNRRNTLLAEMGFDWFDIDNLKPNPNNSYTITDEDVNNLAGLIWNSKEVEPLILRETEDGIRHRWRASLARMQVACGKVWRRMADGSGQMPQAWCRFRRTSQFHHALKQYRPTKHQAIGTRSGLQGSSGQAGGMAQG